MVKATRIRAATIMIPPYPAAIERIRARCTAGRSTERRANRYAGSATARHQTTRRRSSASFCSGPGATPGPAAAGRFATKLSAVAPARARPASISAHHGRDSTECR